MSWQPGSASTVRRAGEIARSAGIDVRRPELSDKVRTQAARLYAEGMTLTEPRDMTTASLRLIQDHDAMVIASGDDVLTLIEGSRSFSGQRLDAKHPGVRREQAGSGAFAKLTPAT